MCHCISYNLVNKTLLQSNLFISSDIAVFNYRYMILAIFKYADRQIAFTE